MRNAAIVVLLAILTTACQTLDTVRTLPVATGESRVVPKARPEAAAAIRSALEASRFELTEEEKSRSGRLTLLAKGLDQHGHINSYVRVIVDTAADSTTASRVRLVSRGRMGVKPRAGVAEELFRNITFAMQPVSGPIPVLPGSRIRLRSANNAARTGRLLWTTPDSVMIEPLYTRDTLALALAELTRVQKRIPESETRVHSTRYARWGRIAGAAIGLLIAYDATDTSHGTTSMGLFSFYTVFAGQSGPLVIATSMIGGAAIGGVAGNLGGRVSASHWRDVPFKRR